MNTDLIATLIANPKEPVITSALADAAAFALGCTEIKWLAKGIAVEFLVPATPLLNREILTKQIGAVLRPGPFDIVVQSAQRNKAKALIADMDSTMIEQECIDELAAHAGLKEQVSQITRRAMNGEIEFEAALKERVALLSGLSSDIIGQTIASAITYTPGGRELVATMKASGAWCALVSGGFTSFTASVAKTLGFDENRANLLIETNGVLEGKVAEPILGRQAKVDALHDIADKQGLRPEDFLAVGDGANDLGMLTLAGTGVALHAKPAVAEQADIRIDHGDLTALLYIQGYHRDEFVTD